MPSSKISRRQISRLRAASTATDPDDFFFSIYSLIREQTDEPLSPEWLELWDRWSDQLPLNLPQGIIHEVEQALANINPIDDEIFKIHPSEDQRVAILLGAGASAPPPSSIPTVVELLPVTLTRFPGLLVS